MRTTIFILSLCCCSLISFAQEKDLIQDLRLITDHSGTVEVYPSMFFIDDVYDQLYTKLQQGEVDQETLKERISVQILSDSVTLYSYQVPVNKGAYRHFGVLNVGDRYFKLHDISDEVPVSETMILRDGDWMGSYIYHARVVPVLSGTLIMTFGYDGHDGTQLKKIIDFIYLSEDGSIETGYPALMHPEGPYYRRIFTYNADNTIRVNYDPDLDLVIFDNLVSMSDAMGRAGGVTDGSYSGYFWDNDRWIFKEKIFDHVYEEAPRPAAILDKREDNMRKKQKTETSDSPR